MNGISARSPIERFLNLFTEVKHGVDSRERARRRGSDLAGTTWLAFSTQSFALFNVALVVVWLVLAILVGRHYKRLTAAPPTS